ncbi:MAG: DUF948 domain-containing protein [Candidatus Gastranaerophilales bacterium]|nr:DUF948 domain-containing protein [Candidatus Gastranaerophilales bacterium]
MEDTLTILLIILTATCIPLFIVITVFVIMLLIDLRELVKSYTKLSETVQKELNPTLEEIKKALESINGLASGVDKQLTAVKSTVGTAYNMAFGATSKLKGLLTSVLGGFLAGYKLFRKK